MGQTLVVNPTQHDHHTGSDNIQTRTIEDHHLGLSRDDGMH
jgi:hypothetical protein